MKNKSVRIYKSIAVCLIIAILLGISLVSVGAAAPDFTDPSSVTAKWMVSYMGRGTNLGNTYEMTMNPKDYASVKKVMDAYISAGFNSVRIPVNFGGRSDAAGNVDFNNADLKNMKLLVDYVLNTVNPQRISQGLKPIILIVDTHHEEWAMHDLIGSANYETNMKRLETIWKGICNFFKDSPDTLIFEFFNEPHYEMQLGDVAEASVVEMNKRLYNVIRNFTVDGKTPHQYRKLLFGGSDWNSIWGLMDAYTSADKLPGGGNDKYIIATYHFYNEIERAIPSMNDAVTNFQTKYDIPVHMGEFGVNHQGNITETVKTYYRTMSDEAIKRNFAISVWDDNGWFQIYNRTAGTYNTLKDIVLGDRSVPTPPEDIPVVPSPIPGQIEAEKYNAMLGFQIEACTDVGGGLNVGYTDPTDWMDYSVDVQTAGTYTVEFRMSGVNPTGTLQLQKAGAVLATVTPPNTGGWQTWQTVTATANLTAGVQTLRLYSTGSEFNINWIKFTPNTPQVATPTFTPAAGTYTSAQTVAIACATAGSTIRYTTDGSTPTATSPVYTTPINVAATTTIKAFATATGITDSPVASAAYVIQAPQVATPTFTPAAGTYTSAQNVAIACATAGSTIRYTTDGSTPTATSPVYTAPINVAATTTIKALATTTGMTNSPVATAAYTINIKPTYPIPGLIEAENYSAMLGFQTEACTDVGGGLNVGYTDSTDWLDYDVNVQTAGTYTVELRMAGLVPTGNLQIQKAGVVLATITPPNTGGYQVWQTVTATVNLTAGVQTLRLYSNNGDKFNINWIKFTANTPQVATPVFTPAAGTYTSAQTVAIACSTAGSTIRYTTDGSTPTATSPIYTVPINVAATTTIKAFATTIGMTDSPVATAAYTINIKPTLAIPGQIEAENYSAIFGFQTQACTDVGGGMNVGYTDPADWLDYDVNVQTAGSYTVEFRMAGLAPTGTLQLQKAGAVLATITPPNTGAWQTWQTVTATVNLTVGVQTLRLYSTGSKFNVNWVKFTANVPQVATPTFTPAAGTYPSAQTVALACATAGSTIRYTTDGSTPTATSPVYTTPINVAATTTIKAFATTTGMTDSPIATATYTISIKPVYLIPGQLEAENYSAMYGIQTEACSDVGGGMNVGYFDVNDWLDYDVNVQTAGTYTVEFRMSGVNPTGTLQLQKAGAVLATVTPTNTGAWTTWQTKVITVNLTAGQQTLRLYSTGSLFNINWVKFTQQ